MDSLRFPNLARTELVALTPVFGVRANPSPVRFAAMGNTSDYDLV